MAHGWNTLCHSPISGILSNAEQNVGNHVDNLIENNNLSSTLVSQESSSVCNLNSTEQQQNYDSLQWNNEAAPCLLLDIPESPLGGKSYGIQDVVADSNTHDTKTDLALLSSSAVEQYSDVSSCSEFDIDITVSPCVELNLDCCQTQEKENTLKLGSKELSMANSYNLLKDECPIKDIKGSIDYKRDACGSSTSENLPCHEGSPLSTVWDRARDLIKGLEDNLQEKYTIVDQEDQYSNISHPLESVRVQSPIREDEEIKDHSTAVGSDGSQLLSTSDCQNVVVEPHSWTSAFETNSVEKVTNTPDGDCKDTVGCSILRKKHVSNGSQKGSNDRSTTRLSQRVHLEINDESEFGTKSIAKDGTHEDRESDCHSPHNIEEERSSFDFLERGLGFRDFSTGSSEKSGCGKEMTRLTNKEGAVSCDGNVLDQIDHENWMPQSEPPTQVPVDLETSFRDELQGSYSAISDKGPPVLSVFLSGAVTNLEESNMSTLDKVEKDVGIRKTNSVQLVSTRRLKQSLHPVVLLKDSIRGKGYHCAQCPMTAQNLSSLFEHNHCVHLQPDLHLCNTCGCYFMDYNLATQHKCDLEVDAAGIFIQNTSLPLTSSMCPQKSYQKGKGSRCKQRKCQYCDRTFQRKYEFYQHMRKHTGVTPFKCGKCGLYFSRPCSLHRHKLLKRCKSQRLKDASEKKIIQKLNSKSPKDQSFKLDELPSVIPHVKLIDCYVKMVDYRKEKQSAKQNSCETCGKCFRLRKQLAAHRRSHTEERPFKCQNCVKTFKHPCNLYRHKKHYCLRTRNPATFTNPLKSLAGEYKCPICQSTFKYSSNRFQHIREVCLKEYSRQGKDKVGNVYNCALCKKTFASTSYRNRHIKRSCLKKYIHRESLKMKRDYQERTKIYFTKEQEPQQKNNLHHKCSFCPATFAHASSKYKHMRKHKMQEKAGKPLISQASLPPLDQKIEDTDTVSNIEGNGTTNQTISMDKFKHRCPHCPKAFMFRCKLLRHLVVHTRNEPVKCSRCGCKYTDRTHYLKHESFCEGVYRGSRLSKVDVKDQPLSASITKKLKSGQITKGEGEEEYKCRFCTKSFMKARNLRRHILTHTEVKPYRCKTCESCFRRYDHLKRHQNCCKGKRKRLEVHILKLNLDDLRKDWQKKPDGAKAKEGIIAECISCGKRFSSNINLARHVALCHATVKPFSCKYCSASFSQESTLKKHNLTHDKRKYVCADCPRRFRNQEQMIVHTRLHTGEKHFGCANCGERFIRRDYLMRHLIKCKFGKESEESTLGEQCGDVFNANERQSHQQSCVVKQRTPDRNPRSTESHRGSPKKRGFSCANCDAQFILFSQLQQHFLSTHRADTYQQPQQSPPPLQQQLSSIGSVKEEPIDEGYEVNELRDGNIRTEKVSKVHNRSDMNTPLVCPYCNLRFINNSGLGMHLRTHTGHFNVFCKRCKRGFGNKNTLRKHKRTCSLPVITTKEPNTETPALTDMNHPVQNTVLVFNSGYKTRGTEVLQTKFSCKEGYKESLDSVEVNEKMASPISSSKIIHKYQCSECDQSFTDGLLLISHLEDHSREEQEQKQAYRCNHCDKVFNQPGVLSRHLKMHKSSKTPYACPECPKTFRYPSDLDMHRHCHDPNRPFFCSLCLLRFWTNKSLSVHTSAVHGSKKPIHAFACQFCTKSYTVKLSYQKHCRMKHYKLWRKALLNGQTKGQVSSQPDFDLAVNAEELNHERTDETDENEEDDDSDSAPYFPCHVCGKTFTTSESLEDHQRCHLGEKPHECAECGKCFFQLSNLQQHQRSHRSEFQCQTCGRGFVSFFALRKHKHNHGKNRPHRCPKCQLSFTGPTQLAEHIATHRDEYFPCDLCDHTFTCKLSRAEHRKSHNEPEECLAHMLPPQGSTSSSLPLSADQLKYRCGICCERFLDPEQLSEHGCFSARERPYTCSNCNQHFLCGAHLKKHQLSHQLSRSYLYQCKHCPMRYTYRHQFLNHLKKHGIEEAGYATENLSYLYQCNRCHMRFNYRHQFLNHLKKHGIEEVGDATENLSIKAISNVTGNNTENIYKCPICPHSFGHALELVEHLSIHAESTYKCRVCGETFASKSILTQHEQCHLTASSQYECAECSYSFLGSDAFRQHQCAHKKHMSRDHVQPVPFSFSLQKRLPSPAGTAVAQSIEEVDVREDFYNCLVCTKQFSSKQSLKEHQRQHTAYHPFKCLVCGKCFAQKRYVKRHQAIHQRTIRIFSKQNLKEHQRQHSAYPPYKCLVCGKCFAQKRYVKRHQAIHQRTIRISSKQNLKERQRQHNAYPPFKCLVCGKCFAQKRYLRRHQAIHQRTYQCDMCPLSFGNSEAYQIHQDLHNQKSQNSSVTTQDTSRHSTKPIEGAMEESGSDYRCDMCYKSFDQLSSLRRHQETHVGQVVYECTECDKAFAFFHLLEEHQNSHASSSSPLPSPPPPHDLSNPVSEQPSPQNFFPVPPVVDYVVGENM